MDDGGTTIERSSRGLRASSNRDGQLEDVNSFGLVGGVVGRANRSCCGGSWNAPTAVGKGDGVAGGKISSAPGR